MYGSILVPLADNRRSALILPEASRLASALGARLVLMRVVPPQPETVYGSGEGELLPPQWAMEREQQDLAAAERDLRAESRKIPAGVPVETVVRCGDVVEEILCVAAEHRCGMIAMSTHGRSGIDHLLHGSVTELVVRRSGLPVLVLCPSPDTGALNPRRRTRAATGARLHA